MRHAIGLTFLATLALPAWAEDKAVEDEKLYGTWAVSSLEIMGQKFPLAEGLAYLVLTKGGKGIRKGEGQPDEEGTWKATATTKAFDWVALKQEAKVDKNMKGIYQLNGDTLILALTNEPGEERPTTFDSRKAAIMTLKRQKP